MDSLPEADQKILGRLVAVAWVDFAVGKRLDDAIVKALGGGSTRVFERLGESSAEVNLATLHNAFLAPGRPAGVPRQGAADLPALLRRRLA